MKLLVLSPSFYLPGQGVRIGGGEISNYLLLQQLARKGHQVCVVSLHGVAGYGSNVDGIRVFNIGSRMSVPVVARALAMARYSREALKIAAEYQPDLVLSITSASAVGLKIRNDLNIPFGIMLRAGNDLTKTNENGSALKRTILNTLMGSPDNRLLNEADFLIVNSKYMKRVFAEHAGDQKIDVVYPPVDEEQRPFKPLTRVRRVVSVGASERKGFAIIKAVASLMPEIHFHVVGDPGLQPGESRSERNLKISGWFADRQDYLDPADLVAVPSVWDEPFGRIAVEALRHGRCVLISGSGGLPEVLDFREELIVSPNKPEEWVRKIRQVDENPDFYQKICASTAKISRKFILKEQAELFEKILEKHARAHT